MILEARGLSFNYPGAGRRALEDLDFSVGAGEVFGFLGPNGSGKSTTQKLLTKILRGYEGRVEVFGRDVEEQASSYFNSIGVCFEFPNLYEKLTADENLGFYRAFFDVPTEEPSEILERLDLPVNDRRPVSSWSKGMKMRLTLARSLMNRPRLWFLDEPTTGQDPQHAVLIRALIRERAQAGTSVFLTTHDMTVADELCDRVAFLVDGRIVRVDTPRDLKLAHRNHRVTVSIAEPKKAEYEFDLRDPADKARFLRTVEDHEVETIHTQEPSLEDVFLTVTGRDLGGAPTGAE